MGLAAAVGAASLAAGLGAMRAADQQQAIAASASPGQTGLRAQLWATGEFSGGRLPQRMTSGAKLYHYGVASTAAGAALLALAASGHLGERADSRGRFARVIDQPPDPQERR